MEMSPASSNVRYFLIYPKAWWEDDSYLGTSGAVSREAAATIVAESSTIPTVEPSDFVWEHDGDGSDLGGATIATTPGDAFVFGTNEPLFRYYACAIGDPPRTCKGIAMMAYTSFSGGGTNVVTDQDGGVNAILVEITATDASGFGVDSGSSDFFIGFTASSDGGQIFTMGTSAYKDGNSEYGTYIPMEDVLTKVKIWRMPTRIWPGLPEPPSNFCTGFIGSREII